MKIPSDPSSRMYCRVEQGERRSIMRRVQGVCGRQVGVGVERWRRILMAVCFHSAVIKSVVYFVWVCICMYESHCSLSKVLIKPQFPSDTNLWELFTILGSVCRHFIADWMPSVVYHVAFIFLTDKTKHYLAVSHTLSDPVCLKMELLIINAICTMVWLLLEDVGSCVCV